MNAPPNPSASSVLWRARWQSFSVSAVHGFHIYGSWLVSISWRRFIGWALALMILVGIVHDMPPFTWRSTERMEVSPPRVVVVPQREPRTPKVPKPAKESRSNESAKSSDSGGEFQISIGKNGIHITPQPRGASDAASGARAAASVAEDGVQITLPRGAVSDAVRQAVEQARREMEEVVREARADAEQAARDAEEARREAQATIDEVTRENGQPRYETHTTRVGVGDFIMQFTMLWILASAVLKFTYKGRMQAEVKAAQATETAEAESLKRQVVEARMAAMQAQVEPHFLFNTLASIDHLIETDPPRASQMQKNLIALLRASMPSMREASGNGSNGLRDLGRELAVIRPYLEILKVRMEERLVTDIDVPEGLLSAEFPPMMIQTLVENAIKHGLEPKAEGGALMVKADIVHGKLQLRVADTGLGFGMAATAGTGVGLANIRERLQLLYGPKAALTVAANQPSGTVVTITVPYKTIEGTPS